MKQKVVITMECCSELVGEILAAASRVAKTRNGEVTVTSVEEKKP